MIYSKFTMDKRYTLIITFTIYNVRLIYKQYAQTFHADIVFLGHFQKIIYQLRRAKNLF